MKVLLASMFALTGVIVNSDLAAANSVTPPASLGYDISFPQCASNLPVSAGFGIVGVNDGHPFSVNPCLARELRWATHTLTASPEFYANVDNPGPLNNANWPTLQQTPQVCFGANSVACSYDYGWNAARGSFHNAVVAESQIGAPSPSMAAPHARWWLDVESGNAWETIRTTTGPTSAAFANDDAVLQGELAYFASAGVTSVGVYSTMSQWIGLMGVTGSSFASTKAWMTGYATLATAQAACASATGSFTGGRVAMIQYPSNGLDGGYQCPLLSSPTSSSVSVALSGTFTNQLAVARESAKVAYAQSTGSPNLNVSSTGLLTTSGPLAAGTYTATGTTSANGDTGTFAFSLAVGSIKQNPPTSASVSVATAVTFTDQLAVTGSSGVVTYVQTSGAPAVVVSPTGLITTSGTLAVGSYVVRGTMSDASGDTGHVLLQPSCRARRHHYPKSANQDQHHDGDVGHLYRPALSHRQQRRGDLRADLGRPGRGRLAHGPDHDERHAGRGLVRGARHDERRRRRHGDVPLQPSCRDNHDARRRVAHCSKGDRPCRRWKDDETQDHWFGLFWAASGSQPRGHGRISHGGQRDDVDLAREGEVRVS